MIIIQPYCPSLNYGFWYLGTVLTLTCLKGVMLSVQENKHQAHFRSLLKLLYHVISTFEIMKNYKRKSIKEQTTIHKTLHRKLMREQQEPH
jgi:hypothetical protein